MSEDGGKVSFDVIPNFGSFGALFSSGIRGALSTAQREGGRIGDLLGGGLKAGVIAGTVAAGVALGQFVASGVKEFLSLTDTARSLERVTGGSAQQVSLFAGVIRSMGGDVDAANKPLGIFAANVASHPELFQKYGIAIARFKDGNTDLLGTLDNVRKKMVDTTNVDERDYIAKQLLSRGYQQLLPYLSLTNDRLAIYQRLAREGGQVVSQKDIDQARDFKVQIQELKDNVERLKVSAGRKAVSIGSEILQGLDAYTKVSGKDLEKSLTSLDPLAFIRPALKEQDAQAGVGRAMAESEVAAQELADAQARLATEEDNVSSAAEGLRSAEEGQASAARAVTKAKQEQVKAHEATQRAVEQEGQAEQNLHDLLAKGPVDAKAVESARKALGGANRQVSDSTDALAAAEQHLVEVQQFESVDAANELTTAHLQLSQATIGLAEARLAAAKAVPTASDPYAAQKARLAVQQATLQQHQAQENLTKVTQYGTQADHNLADAQKQVRDASQRVNDSLGQQKDAQDKLAEAEAGDPEFQRKVADAKRQVADAAIAVRDAKQGETDASDALKDAQQNEEDATNRVRDAHYKLDDAIKSTGADQLQVLDAVEQKYPELAGVVEQSVNRINAAVGSIVHIPDPTGTGLPGAYYDPNTGHLIPEGPMGTPVPPAHRAAGGRVVPGRTYIVNERANEAVTFDAPGMVHSANLTPAGDDGANAPMSFDYDAMAAALLSALVAGGRPLVTAGEQVIIAQQRHRTATRGRV